MNRSQTKVSCKPKKDGMYRKQVEILLENIVLEGISDIAGELGEIKRF